MLIELKNVSYEYRPNKRALQDINLSLEPGEQALLLGANGSGKSTALKIMGGLLFPTQGVYQFEGREIKDSHMRNNSFSYAFRKRVGIVFQHSDVQLFCSTVEEEISFGLRAVGMDDVMCKKRTADILDYMEIGMLAQESPHYLSGGEKKKVVIGAILAVNPSVLLLDEPMNSLDPKSCHWLLTMLDDLRKRKKTIVMATHRLDRLPFNASRAFLFGEDHRLWANTSISALLDDKELLTKANLIG